VSAGRLVVCPTPIGNLEDVTLRALAVLRSADVVACEDTRRTRVLLDRHGIAADGRLVSYHEHNEASRARELVSAALDGRVVALVSDAGMPLVSDPGFVVVAAAVEAGVRVEVLPGASSVLVALVASGLAGGGAWRFVGFLPRRPSDVAAAVAGPETVVAFESPRRVAASLGALDPARRVAVCRELTKVHEEVVRGTAGELAERYASAEPRGEVVLVVAGEEAAEPDVGAALDAVRALVDAGARARPAATVVAGLTGVPANRLYRALQEDRHR
jgi:16S rRNA (cytidine1402-2'-O)-methyltransferase